MTRMRTVKSIVKPTAGLTDLSFAGRQGKVPWSHKQALQAGITAAVDLPGLLGEDIAVAPTPPKGASIPAWRGHPAWQQAAALVRQLGLAGQLEIRPEHLDCVRLLLLHRAGLQLSQLLRVQAACAALAQRKVCFAASGHMLADVSLLVHETF